MGFIKEGNSAAEITALKQALIQHPLYNHLDTLEAIHHFMERHIFCVWDFMSLLKSLQQELTCVSIPWTPPAHPEFARIINEIVLDEESDYIEGLGCYSHFQLYLAAMEEIGADTIPVRKMLYHLQQGDTLDTALNSATIPAEAAQFIQTTFWTLTQPLHVRATVFFHAREDILPQMFLEIVTQLEEKGIPCGLLQTYLQRHIEVDTDHHGPQIQKLLNKLYQENEHHLSQAENASQRCLNARKNLWDTIVNSLRTQAYSLR